MSAGGGGGGTGGVVSGEAEIRQALRDWVVRTSGRIQREELDDETPIIERRIISSVHVLDLILFIEKLSGVAIDVGKLKVGVFRNIDAIYSNFFEGSSGAR